MTGLATLRVCGGPAPRCLSAGGAFALTGMAIVGWGIAVYWLAIDAYMELMGGLWWLVPVALGLIAGSTYYMVREVYRAVRGMQLGSRHRSLSGYTMLSVVSGVVALFGAIVLFVVTMIYGAA